MTYLAHVNRCISQAIAARPCFVSFGQNVGAGSHLSGLTRNLPSGGGHRVLNMPNCENAQVGFGFGLMLQGVDCAFFCKQLDFLLLACDQIVNTWNMVRLRRPSASFTIVCIVVDSGFEGPQSRLNALADFSSLADIAVFSVSNGPDAEAIIDAHMVAPGFRIIAVSQRLFSSGISPAKADFSTVGTGTEASMLRHETGDHATIAAFNFAYPQAAAIHRQIQEKGLTASLFSIAGLPVADWLPMLADAKRTGRLILIDDSRSRNRAADGLCAAIAEAGIACRIARLYRTIDEQDIRPHADRFSIDFEELCRTIDLSPAQNPGM